MFLAQILNIKSSINLRMRKKMVDDRYRFKVGSFDCLAVSDGTFTYPSPSPFLFANAPKERLPQALLSHNVQMDRWEEWTSPYICLVIDTGRHLVLVDTGAGGLGQNTGKLLQNLEAEGISVGDIDTITLTHGHPDHVGGNTDSEGRSAFPHASFVMGRDEWDFWTSEPDLSGLKADEHIKELLVTFAQKNLLPIRGQLDLVDTETEIVPGIRAVPAPGHTPGHMALAISSEGQRLLVTSDAVIHPVHVEHPEWYAAVDIDPERVVDTRRRLLNRATVEKALVLAFHFPFPGLGRVVQREEGWRWRPVETTG